MEKEQPQVQVSQGITMDDVFAQLGRMSVQLEAANKQVAQANNKVVQLTRRIAELDKDMAELEKHYAEATAGQKEANEPDAPAETQKALDAIPFKGTESFKRNASA
jgi:chromosome segregation ATPase